MTEDLFQIFPKCYRILIISNTYPPFENSDKNIPSKINGKIIRQLQLSGPLVVDISNIIFIPHDFLIDLHMLSFTLTCHQIWNISILHMKICYYCPL